MSTQGSVSGWLVELRTNGEQAAKQLWERYFERQVAVAHRELERHPRREGFDSEDVALSAFDAFCRGMRNGQHAGVTNRDDLWRLLFVITVRKANDRLKSQRSRKRGGNAVAVDLSDLSPPEVERFLSHHSDPQLSAAMQDECQRLLKALDDPNLEQVALLKLDGHTNDEIAELMGCVRQTVQRRLKLIRRIWEAL